MYPLGYFSPMMLGLPEESSRPVTGKKKWQSSLLGCGPASAHSMSWRRTTGKATSNLSGTLRTMEGNGLVRLERGERGRHHAEGDA
jgi:hypothetical protein